jgi:hypothetical protein
MPSRRLGASPLFLTVTVARRRLLQPPAVAPTDLFDEMLYATRGAQPGTRLPASLPQLTVNTGAVVAVTGHVDGDAVFGCDLLNGGTSTSG